MQNEAFAELNLGSLEESLEELPEQLVSGVLENGDRFSGILEAYDDDFLWLKNHKGKSSLIDRVQIARFWQREALE